MGSHFDIPGLHNVKRLQFGYKAHTQNQITLPGGKWHRSRVTATVIPTPPGLIML